MLKLRLCFFISLKFQALQAAFARCVSVLSASSTPEDMAVEVHSAGEFNMFHYITFSSLCPPSLPLSLLPFSLLPSLPFSLSPLFLSPSLPLSLSPSLPLRSAYTSVAATGCLLNLRLAGRPLPRSLIL